MAMILKSSIPYKGPETENLVEFIRDGLQNHPKATILIDSKTNTRWTGEEIEKAISSLAKHLIEEYGLKKGDACNLYGPESDKIVILILSIISAGGVCNFLTDKCSGREIHDTIAVLRSKFLFSHSKLLKRIQGDLKDLESQLRVASLDEPCDGFKNGCESIANFLQNDELKSSFNLDNLIAMGQKVDKEDFAVIQFSSGTTGKPKPIPRTHKNLCHLASSVNHEQLMDLKPGVVMTGSLPITHRPGLWAVLASVRGGSTFVIWSNLSDVDDALATVEKYKVNIFSSSLPFLSMLGNIGPKIKDKFDTSSWEHIITSGAKIVNPDLPRSIIKEFNLKSLRQCFGMTESGWVFLIEKNLAEGNYLSVGHVCPSMEAIVINRETQEKLGPFERGEIALRSPQIFPGYLTSELGVYNRSDFIEGGWFRTGDQGYYDENELVFIEGRYKEVMMFQNNCLYFPNEIEAIITEHPAIEGACVVKVAEVRQDYPYDVARAFVTLKENYELTEKELIEFVQERTPEVIIGGGVKMLDKFPRLQNGKVDKQALKEL